MRALSYAFPVMVRVPEFGGLHEIDTGICRYNE